MDEELRARVKATLEKGFRSVTKAPGGLGRLSAWLRMCNDLRLLRLDASTEDQPHVVIIEKLVGDMGKKAELTARIRRALLLVEATQ